MYTPKEKRHVLRGLRHRLVDATPKEVERYEKEVAEHMQDDNKDKRDIEVQARASELLAKSAVKTKK
jgi:hypothetical protein